MAHVRVHLGIPRWFPHSQPGGIARPECRRRRRTIHTNRIEDLNERVDEMALIMRGIWALLEDGGVTREQLMAKLEELDMQDGVADGRVRQAPVDCPSCDSRVAPGLSKCQFCGADINRQDDHPLGRL